MTYTATALRKSIYSVLDEILETGIPVTIERHGKTLKIVPEKPVSKLDRLITRNCVIGDSDDLPDIHWEDLWSREPEI